MLIAVDGRQAYRKEPRGIGKSLIASYRCLARLRPEWRFRMFHQAPTASNPFAGLANVEARRIDMPGADRFNLWEQLRLPLAARTAGAAVLHCPTNTGPCFPLLPLVLTVHDLIPVEMNPGAPEVRTWEARVSAAARKARRLITPSAYSKDRIVERLGVAGDKIIVNPWAADENMRRTTDADKLKQVRRKYGLPPDAPYVFGFGAQDPRKNTRRILEAWSALPVTLQSKYRLLLVGVQEPALTQFRELADGQGHGSRVLLHGFADEEDLPALLSGSTALCYPSLNEGFGLPLLDAFVCGTAVLTSAATSLPEVAGDAAVLVDPHQVTSIRDGFIRLLTDEELRRRLIARGRERIHHYRWENCAEVLAQALEQASRPLRKQDNRLPLAAGPALPVRNR